MAFVAEASLTPPLGKVSKYELNILRAFGPGTRKPEAGPLRPPPGIRLNWHLCTLAFKYLHACSYPRDNHGWNMEVSG